jgi:membrane protein required for colicin V production
MAWTVDCAIVVVLLMSVLGGLSRGFLRAFCALGGAFFGLLLAAWNYTLVASILTPLVRSEIVADALAFLGIAAIVIAAANLAGASTAKTLHYMGFGCLDRLAGGVFGFLQGALIITLIVLVAVAFFPQAHWLVQAKLPRMFFGACHLSTHMSPAELADRVREGLRFLEQEAPQWMHPGTGTL